MAGAGALALAAATARGRGRDLDVRLYRAMNRDRGPAEDALWAGITELGSIWASAGATVVLGSLGRRQQALDAFGAAGTMWLLGQLLKRTVMRPRPYQALRGFRLRIGEPAGSSWPSSHPAVLLAYLTVVTRNLEAGPTVRAAAGALAAAVGVSRVHLGVHYPADVVGGLLLGRGVADLWSGAISPRVLGPPVGHPAGRVAG